MSGEKKSALEILQNASGVSAGTMNRVRQLSDLAISTGQPEIAEEVMGKALQMHKHSPVRKANDYAVLSKAFVNQGKISDAFSTLIEAQKSFNDPHSAILLAASLSLAHSKEGNEDMAVAALAKAMSFSDVKKIPPGILIAIADACLALGKGKEKDAASYLRYALQNNQNNEEIKDKVHEVLIAAGKNEEEAAAMIEDCNREIIVLNNDGVRKAREGKFTEAITMLCNAADRLPNNLQIVGNAALVIAIDISINGDKDGKLRKCLQYRDRLIKQAPFDPKLVQIDTKLKLSK